MQHSLAIGIDVGGTKVEGSLVSGDGKVHHTLRLPSPPDPKTMLSLIEQMVDDLSGNHSIQGVGFSIPGSLDPQTGRLRNAPNSPAVQGTHLARNLAHRLSHPLFFENDANCLVLSEYHFGAARGFAHVAGVIMGTGIGVGILYKGELFHTPRGLAPEPGHLPLNVNGRPCLCGNLGCVEAYLSGPSILRRYREAGGVRETTAEIFAHQEKDPAAAATLAETRFFFARFMAMLVSMYDPELIVLGGGLSRQNLYYQTQELTAPFIFGSRQVPPIRPAQGGDASGKLGAAALVFQALRHKVDQGG